MKPSTRHAGVAFRPTLIVLLALLCAGAAAHFEHHLLEPLCGDGQGPQGHLCLSCSVLHGGAVVEDTAAVAVPRANLEPLDATPAARAALPAPDCLTAPRAPPSA
jgi:hypothetical protein